MASRWAELPGSAGWCTVSTHSSAQGKGWMELPPSFWGEKKGGKPSENHTPSCSHAIWGTHVLFDFSICITDLLAAPQAFYSFSIKQQLKQAAKAKLDLCIDETKSWVNSFSFPSIDSRKTERHSRSMSPFTLCLQVAADYFLKESRKISFR